MISNRQLQQLKEQMQHNIGMKWLMPIMIIYMHFAHSMLYKLALINTTLTATKFEFLNAYLHDIRSDIFVVLVNGITVDKQLSRHSSLVLTVG